MSSQLHGLEAVLGNRYRLERELGRGGMATVYLVRDLRHDRLVALKVLHPELAATLGPERFLREIRIAAGLTHPNILPLHDSGEAGGRLYYVMPFVEGESLRDRMQREGQLPLADALRMAREVAEALDHAHRHGIVHRDVKPENILLEDGHAVVADFGVARAVDAAGTEQLTATGLAVGTPAYMSPEQGAGERKLDGRTDVYSLGCVLYEMLAGEPPFTGRSAQVVMAKRLAQPAPSLGTVRNVPPGVEEAVTRALARAPADRFATSGDFAEALVAPTAPRRASRRPSRRRLAALGIGVGLVLAAIGVALRPWSRPQPSLDGNLVAVAPFHVLAPRLELWGEGFVDVLSRNLDGAGPLRTVAPPLVLRHWRGPGDRAAAVRLGRSTGAGLVVFGSLIPAGPDSIRLAATLVDAKGGDPVGDIEVRELESRMDRLTDSATVRLIRELGRRQPIGAVRRSHLAAVDLPVLRSFLQGEQLFRRTAWDSAMGYYERAVSLDSGFALAWRRMNGVRGCGRKGFRGDPLAHEYGLRAGALNRGLAPRDSLLIVADSLSEALFEQFGNPTWREHHARLFATLDAALHRHPNDPEVWYELGEALFHWPKPGHTTPDQVLAAFDRAIALDSAFGPAYIHPIELSFRAGRVDAGRRYLGAYLALNQTDPNSEGMGIVTRLLGGSPASPEAVRQLESASSYVLFSSLWVLRHVPDSAETAVRVARAFYDSRPSGEPVFDDSTVRKWGLGRALAHRGHLREAHALVGDLFPEEFIHYALAGTVPAERARAAFAEWMRVMDPKAMSVDLLGAWLGALAWWSSARDTAALREASRRWEALARKAAGAPELELWARYGIASSQAHLVLARGDTAEAVRQFTALPDSVCPCLLDRIVAARLLSATGQPGEAKGILERTWTTSWDPAGPWLLLERARVADRLGEREPAAQLYQHLADLWRNADPELQPLLAEVRAGVQRLRG